MDRKNSNEEWSVPLGLALQFCLGIGFMICVDLGGANSPLNGSPFWFSAFVHVVLSAAIIAPNALLLKKPWGYIVEVPILILLLLFAELSPGFHDSRATMSFPYFDFHAWLAGLYGLFLIWGVFRMGVKGIREERDRREESERVRMKVIDGQKAAEELRLQALQAETPADGLYMRSVANQLEGDVKRLRADRT